MFRDKTSRSSTPHFLTVKSPSPIPIFSDLHHDALRQFALDGSIETIDHIEAVTIDALDVRLDAIIIRRALKKYIVEIEGDRPLQSIDDDGLYLLAAEQLGATPVRLTAAFVRRRPALQNAREIWNQSRRNIDQDSWIEIQRALGSHGSMTIADLQQQLGQDITQDIFALACATHLNIDIEINLARSNVSVGGQHAGLTQGIEFRHGRRA